jgi:hypothetical protein
MFAGKAEAYPMPANIRLGWKALPGTNALGYYENQKIIEKDFYIIGPRLVQ